MTDREKIEALARWMGYNVVESSDDGVREYMLDPWWNPLRNTADAMEMYERLVMLRQSPWLVSYLVDGSPIHRLDFVGIDVGRDCSTIPAAICEAVVEWIGEKGE